MATCKYDGCNGRVNARGWCSTHYSRWANTGTPDRACLGCGKAVKDGRTRWCSKECKPLCCFDGCTHRAYASNGLCGGHDRQRNETGVLRPFKFVRPAPGGKCAVCDAQIPEGKRRKTCSAACRQREHRHPEGRPKAVECRGCGASVSVTERRPDGKLRRSDAKWCDTCLDDASRRRVYRYGISPDEYQRALIAGCEICGCTDKPLHIDHDHSCCPGGYTCGSCVRGFLCGSCNRAFGLFKNDANTLLAAAAYALRTEDVLGSAATSSGGASSRS